MKLRVFKEIMQLSVDDIKRDVLKGKKSLFQFRFHGGATAVKAHEIKATRRGIAQLKTALSMKSFQGVKGE